MSHCLCKILLDSKQVVISRLLGVHFFLDTHNTTNVVIQSYYKLSLFHYNRDFTHRSKILTNSLDLD